MSGEIWHRSNAVRWKRRCRYPDNPALGLHPGTTPRCDGSGLGGCRCSSVPHGRTRSRSGPRLPAGYCDPDSADVWRGEPRGGNSSEGSGRVLRGPRDRAPAYPHPAAFSPLLWRRRSCPGAGSQLEVLNAPGRMVVQIVAALTLQVCRRGPLITAHALFADGRCREPQRPHQDRVRGLFRGHDEVGIYREVSPAQSLSRVC